MKEFIIPIVTEIIGFAASEFLSSRKRKEDSKERLLLGNYILRQNAYVNLSKALKEYESYFQQFINPGSDFLVSEDLKYFAPLGYLDNLNDKIKDEELWFDSQTSELIIDTINQINEHLKDITGMKDLDIKMDYFFPSEKA